MNIALLIAVTFTLTLVHGNNQPCLRNYNNNAYNTFVWRHVIQESFNRQSTADWEMYIRKYGLCNRPRQSFIEGRDIGRVVQICNGSGRPLLWSYQGNLCISPSTMLMYDLTVDNNCRVRSLMYNTNYVIVACDVVVNHCLPVHWERYSNQRPDTTARPCMP